MVLIRNHRAFPIFQIPCAIRIFNNTAYGIDISTLYVLNHLCLSCERPPWFCCVGRQTLRLHYQGVFILSIARSSLSTSRASGSLSNSEGRQHSLLSPLDCLPAKAGGAVNGGAYTPFILTVDWLGWLCYFLIFHVWVNITLSMLEMIVVSKMGQIR